jgi:hypothetical protein
MRNLLKRNRYFFVSATLLDNDKCQFYLNCDIMTKDGNIFNLKEITKILEFKQENILENSIVVTNFFEFKSKKDYINFTKK